MEHPRQAASTAGRCGRATILPSSGLMSATPTRTPQWRTLTLTLTLTLALTLSVTLTPTITLALTLTPTLTLPPNQVRRSGERRRLDHMGRAAPHRLRRRRCRRRHRTLPNPSPNPNSNPDPNFNPNPYQVPTPPPRRPRPSSCRALGRRTSRLCRASSALRQSCRSTTVCHTGLEPWTSHAAFEPRTQGSTPGEAGLLLTRASLALDSCEAHPHRQHGGTRLHPGGRRGRRRHRRRHRRHRRRHRLARTLTLALT